MPTLKYWDGAAWQYVGGSASPVAFRRTGYAVNDNATGGGVNINATAYGAHFGPAVNAWMGVLGATVHFYCQVGLTTTAPGSDLVVAPQLLAYPSGTEVLAPNDNYCLYVAPPAAGYNGPGFVSGIMFVTPPSPGEYTVQMHYRVSVGVTNIMRRRLAVFPHELMT